MDSPPSAREPVASPDTPYARKRADEKLDPQTENPPLKQLTQIQSTNQGTEILKRLAAQGNDLLKSPSSAGGVSLNKKNLEWLTSVIKDLPGASVKAIDEQGFHHALVIEKENKKEDVWYIKSIGPALGGLFGFGSWGFTFIHKDDPQTIAVHEGKMNLSEKDLLHILDEARHNAISQKNDPAGVKAFDLTKQRPIGYLCFNGFDEDDKTSRTQYYDYSNALPELLTRCGYDMVCLDNKKRITELEGLPTPNAVAGLIANPSIRGFAGFVATPYENNAKLIERQVDALYQQGVRDFYLNFLTHGDKKDGMKAYDGAWLKGEDLKKILLKYSNCNFAIDATGCEGGGLIGMMRDFKDAPDAPEGRIGVFVHTKEDFSTLSHEYQSLLVKMLADMADGVKDAPQTYGAAHYRADIERRRLSNGRHDPEFLKSMPGQASLKTAQNDGFQPGLRDAGAQQQVVGNITPADATQQQQWTAKIQCDEPKSGHQI